MLFHGLKTISFHAVTYVRFCSLMAGCQWLWCSCVYLDLRNGICYVFWCVCETGLSLGYCPSGSSDVLCVCVQTSHSGFHNLKMVLKCWLKLLRRRTTCLITRADAHTYSGTCTRLIRSVCLLWCILLVSVC